MKQNKINQNRIVSNLILNSNNGLSISEQNKILGKVKLNLFKNAMKKYVYGSVAVLSLVLCGLFVYNNYLNKPNAVAKTVDEVVSQIKTNSNNNADSAMKIAVDDHQSLTEAGKVLSFNILRPSETKGGKLAQIQTGRTFDGSKSDGLYTTFVDDNQEIFMQINEMKTDPENIYVPEKSEKLSINVNGNKVDAYYQTFYTSDIDPNSEMALYGGTQSKSSLDFYVDGVQVSISQFGNLSKQDLVDVAVSMK